MKRDLPACCAEGNYKYTIKTGEELEEPEDKYKDIIQELEVDVFYDPVINKLRVDSNADNLILTDDYLYDKEEYQKIQYLIIYCTLKMHASYIRPLVKI